MVSGLDILGLAVIWAGNELDVGSLQDHLLAIAEWWRARVHSHPGLFVLGFTVLPYVGVPSSFFYLVAAGVYGPGYGAALAWSWLGLAFNIILGYFIGSRWLRGPIARWLERRGRRLPQVPPDEVWRLVLLTRILPGPPLVAQNFLLAVAGVPFWPYLLYSLPVQMVMSLGLVIFGQGLFKGNSGLLITGGCAMVAVALIAHFVNKAYQKRRQPGPPPAETAAPVPTKH
jgi:uncharacterized membrane protein YdjX (TVP38/TMEM64 family)